MAEPAGSLSSADLHGSSKLKFFAAFMLKCAALFWALFFLVLVFVQRGNVRWEWSYWLFQIAMIFPVFLLYGPIAYWRFRRRSRLHVKESWHRRSSFSKGFKAADVGNGFGYLE